MLGQLPGIFYTEVSLPAAAGAAASALEGILSNPFQTTAKIVSYEVYPIESVTGDNTNTVNYNLVAVDGTTEIGNCDFGTGSNGTRGVAKTGTLSGTAAQLTLDAGESVFVQREKVGTSPARVAGWRVRIGWRGAGV